MCCNQYINTAPRLQKHAGQSESKDTSGQEQRIPFTNRLLAFRALKQGLKFRYDSWQMWANYMVVAMDVGELGEACRALGRVVEERSGHLAGAVSRVRHTMSDIYSHLQSKA